MAIKQIILQDEDQAHEIPIPAQREIAILRSLKHPNIIGALDVAVGEECKDIYLMLEYVEQVGLSGNRSSSPAVWLLAWE